MDPVDVFSVRDLRQRSGDLLKNAENGQVAVITKHGRPAILAVPFDARLLDLGVDGLMSDFPERLVTAVRRREGRSPEG